MKVRIEDKYIGEGEPVFIIAEAGVNHNGNIEMGKKLIEVASECGADAVKFQTFKAENIITKDAPKARYHIETIGNEESWFALLKSQELNDNAHKILIEHCKKHNIIFLSTPYDKESADLLEKYNVPAYKIASTDANNIPLLKHIAKKNKPIIFSTGMCTIEEVKESVNAILENPSFASNQLIVLHCSADYPAKIRDANIRVIETLKKEFQDTKGIPIGYSNHVLGKDTVLAAVAKEAHVIEMHITLDKTLHGPDHRASYKPEELKDIIESIRKTETALGSKEKFLSSAESENRKKLMKSVVAEADIETGDILTEENIAVKRPGTGIPPKYYYDLIGKKTKTDIKFDEVITFNMVEGMDKKNIKIEPSSDNSETDQAIINRVPNKFRQIYDSEEFKRPYRYPLRKFPFILDIEVTNKCNLGCLMCPRQDMKREQHLLDYELYKKAIDEAAGKGALGIRLIRYGEPMLHPKIIEMIKYVKDKGLLAHMTTNGLLWGKGKMQQVLDARPDTIIFSFQGTNKEEYTKMRDNPHYDLLSANIKKFVEMRNEQGLTEPHVQVTTTVLDETEKEIEEFINNWLKTVDSCAHWYTTFARLERTDKVKEMLKRQTVKEHLNKGPCVEILTKLSINSDGTVSGCCGDFDKQLVVGDFKNNTLEEIWHGDTIKRIREIIERGEKEKILLCSTCANQYMDTQYKKKQEQENKIF